jgi:hypothetical protein
LVGSAAASGEDVPQGQGQWAPKGDHSDHSGRPSPPVHPAARVLHHGRVTVFVGLKGFWPGFRPPCSARPSLAGRAKVSIEGGLKRPTVDTRRQPKWLDTEQAPSSNPRCRNWTYSDLLAGASSPAASTWSAADCRS